MALTSNEISETKSDEVNQSSSDSKVPTDYEEVGHVNEPLTAFTDEEQRSSFSVEFEDESLSEKKTTSLPPNEILDGKRRNLVKTRSVSFAPMVEEYEIPARSSFSSDCSSEFLDALVDSYKLQTAVNLYSFETEKKYVPKTTCSRLNPNWREHRIRRLMNKLEELSLWDREGELKVTQAQALREQKLEQIQDRQRNNNLCLTLMRQRHESEMESAILLDHVANSINNESVSATIAQTIKLALPAHDLTIDLPLVPYKLKRRVQQEQEKLPSMKTPIGQYRQFETNMNNKLEKINQHLQPDREIMRAYNPYYTSIPTTVVPLFSETYASLLSIPDSYSSDRYHRGGSSNSHRLSPHASSPDYETRARSYSNRDVRVPFKEQSIEDNHDDGIDDGDHHYHNYSQLKSTPLKRATSLISTTASSLYDCSTLRDYSSLHSRPLPLNSVHRRTLNDDLNALTYHSYERNKKSLQNILAVSNDMPAKSRLSSISTNKRVAFIDDDEENLNYNRLSRTMCQPKLICLSATN